MNELMGTARAAVAKERGMNIEIGTDTLQAIRRQAQSGYPEEICGGLLGREGNHGVVQVVEATALRNTRSDERGRRYLIGPDDVLLIEKRADSTGLQVVGYYHSHPDAPAVPSEFDRQHAWPWYTYLIVDVQQGRPGRARAWRLTDDRRRFIELTLVENDGVITDETEES